MCFPSVSSRQASDIGTSFLGLSIEITLKIFAFVGGRPNWPRYNPLDFGNSVSGFSLNSDISCKPVRKYTNDMRLTILTLPSTRA